MSYFNLEKTLYFVSKVNFWWVPEDWGTQLTTKKKVIKFQSFKAQFYKVQNPEIQQHLSLCLKYHPATIMS